MKTIFYPVPIPSGTTHPLPNPTQQPTPKPNPRRRLDQNSNPRKPKPTGTTRTHPFITPPLPMLSMTAAAVSLYWDEMWTMSFHGLPTMKTRGSPIALHLLHCLMMSPQFPDSSSEREEVAAETEEKRKSNSGERERSEERKV
jgi:hypothetical protein